MAGWFAGERRRSGRWRKSCVGENRRERRKAKRKEAKPPKLRGEKGRKVMMRCVDAMGLWLAASLVA